MMRNDEDKLGMMELGGRKRGSAIEVRKVNFATGGANAQRKQANAGQSLRMAAMSMGAGTVIPKEFSTDPQMVVVSREKEKMALQELNDRFAAYIERVRFLEADNKRLQGLLTALTTKYDELDAALRAIYEQELATARSVIDQTTAAKAAVDLKVGNLETNFKEVTALYEAELRAHIISKENVPKLEKMISERDAQIDFLTKNVATMESELLRIKSQTGGLQQELAAAKQLADAETINRVELESLVQTRDDELLFVKAMYEEKVKALLSLDLGSDAFSMAFSNELALALRDIRAEYESIMEATRSQDSDAWYRAKFNEVMSVTQKQTGDLASIKDEARAWRNKYNSLNGEFSSLRGMVGGLEEQIRVLQGELKDAEENYQSAIEERDGRINALNFEVTELIASIKSLTDLKLALDGEIAVYRRLLMSESGRNYSSEQIVTTTSTMMSSSSSSSSTMSGRLVNPFLQENEKEDAFFLAAFKHCDADNSGHVTTTELKNAFEWMNQNGFGGRAQRQISYPYVDKILKMGDVDSSLTLEYPEFCRLLRIEKRVFAEDLFGKYDHLKSNAIGMDEMMDVLKQCGYVYTDNWGPYLKQFQTADGKIDYAAFIKSLR